MRAFLLAATLAAASFAMSAAVPPKPVLARWHWVGSANLANNTNGSRLRHVLAQPTTQRLLTGALDKLARMPGRCLAAPGAAAAATAARWVRPCLTDLLSAENFGLVEGVPGQTLEWVVSVRLTPEQAQTWQTRWTKLVEALGSAAPVATKSPVSGLEASWTGAHSSRFAHVGSWCVVAMGGRALPGFAAVVEQIRAHGTPGNQSDRTWFAVEADLPQLAPLMKWPAWVNWPQVHLSLIGRGPNVHTTGTLTYPEPLSLHLSAWRIPTHTICEPLIAFTAVRGIGAWLAEQKPVQLLDVKPVPNQVFSWADRLAPYMTYLAWQWPDPTNTLREVAPRLHRLFPHLYPLFNRSTIAYHTNTARIVWSKLPLVVPFLAPANRGDPGFVVAGVFPVNNKLKPVTDPALYQQIRGHTKLVYYHWEITQLRLNDWRIMSLFHSMLSNYAPPGPNDPAMRWLSDTNVTRWLGNAVTELSVQSPTTLNLVRTSATGFTGFEMVNLARWLENPAFPGWVEPKLALHPHPAGAATLPRGRIPKTNHHAKTRR